MLCLSLAAAASATADNRSAWIEFFRTQAYPLQTAQDLDPLIEAVAERKLVLLGESTHGTREYYVWRDRISRRLIEEKAFNFIAVEGDWEAIYALNRYVKAMPGSAGSAHEVLMQLQRWPQWMWANQEVVELAEWLREYNAERPENERVGFYGVDVYGWGDSVSRLPGLLNALEPGWGDSVQRQLQPLKRLRGDNRRFHHAVVAGRPSTAPVLDAVVRRLKEERDRLREKDPHSYMLALQSARLTQQAKLHMRASADGRGNSWNPRAVNFMDTVERLFDYYGENARGILWAHNTHIGDGRHTPMGQSGMVNSGQLARERLGPEQCFIVGFATRQGELLAGRSWEAPRETMRMPPAREDSFEAWMHAAGVQQALFLFQPVAEEALFLQPGYQRAIGVIYSPANDHRQNYVPTVLPLRYDALLYFEHTHPLDPLH